MTTTNRKKQAAAQAALVFAALGDPTRLAIVERLGSSGPQSITQIADQSTVTRQAVTKHLNVLDEAGLVRSVKRGRERIWQVEAGRLADARQFLDHVSAQWDVALARLKHYVEK